MGEASAATESTSARAPWSPRPAISGLILAAIGAGLTLWSWDRWPDPMIDFGRELYVAWQIHEGAQLYRDLAYFNGPLSPTINALLFDLFGASLRTLVVANLAILCASVFLLFRLLREISSSGTATVCCATFLLIFGFGQLGPVANFNYVTPYSHEMTHGFALALAALTALAAHLRSSGSMPLALCGLCLGLSFLTKPEIFLATTLAVGTGLLLHLLRERPPLATLAGRTGVFCAMVLAPGLIAFGSMSRSMPAQAALDGTLGGWAHVFTPGVTSLVYYKSILGINRPSVSLAGIARIGILYATVLGAPLLLINRSDRLSRIVMSCGPPLLLLLLFPLLGFSLYNGLLPLPVATLILLVIALSRVVRGRPNAVLFASCVALAAGFLFKIALHAGVAHYGFVLSVPATMLVIVALLEWVPGKLDARPIGGNPYRAAVLGILGIAVVAHLAAFQTEFDRKIYRVGAGADAFDADPRGGAAQDFMDGLEERIEPDASLVVMPEGVMLNYLGRRINPTRFIVFLPPEIAMWGEDAVIEALEADPPDYIAYTQRSTVEYGLPVFGIHYGQKIAGWVKDHYRMKWLVGAMPLLPKRLRDHRWGIKLMERIDAPQSDAP